MIKRLLIILTLSSLAFGQASVRLMPSPHMQFLDSNGVPLSGGCVWTYQAGTVTNQAAYTDSTGSVQQSDPIILDSGGFANIWLDQTKNYKIKVVSAGGSNCSTGTTQWTVDNVQGSFSSLLAPDGSCSAPAWSFSGETTTGVIRNGSGTMDFCSAGTDVLKINSTAIVPFTAGGLTAGSAAKPFSSVYLGAAATNNAQLTGTFTAARVFTFPDITDTMAALAATQTFTNKTFKVDTTTFVDPTDVTKTWKFQLSGMTAAKTLTLASSATVNRTLTFPDATDTLVGLATTDTLTNKTITAPTMTSPTINTGVSQGSGFKHIRVGGICTTGAAAGNGCTTTFSWPVAFADTNYTVVCTGIASSNIAVLSISSISASQVILQIITASANAATFASVDCAAWHD